MIHHFSQTYVDKQACMATVNKSPNAVNQLSNIHHPDVISPWRKALDQQICHPHTYWDWYIKVSLLDWGQVLYTYALRYVISGLDYHGSLTAPHIFSEPVLINFSPDLYEHSNQNCWDTQTRITIPALGSCKYFGTETDLWGCLVHERHKNSPSLLSGTCYVAEDRHSTGVHVGTQLVLANGTKYIETLRHKAIFAMRKNSKYSSIKRLSPNRYSQIKRVALGSIYCCY